MNGSKLLLVTASLILMLALSAHPTPAQTSIAVCGTINASGSYVLTGNLSAAGTCLSVVNGDVTIDLRGFTIS